MVFGCKVNDSHDPQGDDHIPTTASADSGSKTNGEEEKRQGQEHVKEEREIMKGKVEATSARR